MKFATQRKVLKSRIKELRKKVCAGEATGFVVRALFVSFLTGTLTLATSLLLS